MTTASTLPAEAAEATPVETAGRWPLFLLAGSGVLWLVLSGIITLAASIQLHQPGFLAGCPLLTYGHLQAMGETAFTYGWIGNAGLALALWMLGRFSGEPLRAPLWAIAGAVFWNVALLLALVGVLFAGATAVPYLEIPRHLQPILLVAYAAISVPGILAWTGRRRDLMFASQWYAVAALFLFPWLFSAAQVVLFWRPAHGVVQAVAAAWFAQSLWSLWMAPLALAAAYYVLPRVTGKALPSYDSTLLGFWALLFVGGLTCGRDLIGGPVPAWIPTLGIVSCFVVLVHYIVVFLNLRVAYGAPGVSSKFIRFGLTAYILVGLLTAVTSIRGVLEPVQFTLIGTGLQQLGRYGAVSMMLFGALYFAAPRILGRPWASGGLVRAHLALTIIGLLVLLVSLACAGFAQSHALANPQASFAALADGMRPGLIGASAGEAILLLGNILLALNLAGTAVSAAREHVEGLLK